MRAQQTAEYSCPEYMNVPRTSASQQEKDRRATGKRAKRPDRASLCSGTRVTDSDSGVWGPWEHDGRRPKAPPPSPRSRRCLTHTQESAPRSAELRAFPCTPDSPYNRVHSRGPSQLPSRRPRSSPVSSPPRKQALLAWVVYAAPDPAPTRPHRFPADRHSRGSGLCLGCLLPSTVTCAVSARALLSAKAQRLCSCTFPKGPPQLVPPR